MTTAVGVDGHGAARRRRMTGRDPAEGRRGATPLELLFDLVFVVAIGTALATSACTAHDAARKVHRGLNISARDVSPSREEFRGFSGVR